MHQSLLFVVVQLLATTVLAQNCPQYTALVQNADARWKAGAFEEAFIQLVAAREHCPEKSRQIDEKLMAFTFEISKKYREAETEREKAIAAEQKAAEGLDKRYFYNDS